LPPKEKGEDGSKVLDVTFLTDNCMNQKEETAK